MQRLTLFIPGIPKPKQSVRSRIVQSGGRPYTQHYQTKAVKDEERSIKMIIREQLPEGFTCHAGPVIVAELRFQFPPTASLPKKVRDKLAIGYDYPKTTKPDLTDNLQKGLFDAMEGLVFVNDSRIFEVFRCQKVYTNNPGIKILLMLLDESEVYDYVFNWVDKPPPVDRKKARRRKAPNLSS